ncbi:MAG: [Bacteroidaceae bacterium]|nr:[FeFe] hydrogenase H-cluster maturation GTPase HydF [Bacteroidaceae bacterium]
MNTTPSSERLHIGFFGRSNVGKSSLINAVTGQELSLVAEEKGTTTDPVQKAMELLPLGPVVVFDTPGLDDDTKLGPLRVRRGLQMLNRADIAILVIDATAGMTPADTEILERIRKKQVPCIIAVNKCDEANCNVPVTDFPVLQVSAITREGVEQLKNLIGQVLSQKDTSQDIVGDLLSPGDIVVLVTPIDAAAPKGRLILPQVQVLRNVLDCGAMGLVTQVPQLHDALSKLATPPRIVITDSQAFKEVAAIVPQEVPLTSFSILFSRYKGYLNGALKGVQALNNLKDGDYVLISEGCTHHRQCGDIGTEKLPKLITKHTGAKINFEFSSGMGFPEELGKYAAIVHCGGCMLTEREMRYRAKCAEDQNIPFTNYGIVLAHLNGILQRSIEPLNL